MHRNKANVHHTPLQIHGRLDRTCPKPHQDWKEGATPYVVSTPSVMHKSPGGRPNLARGRDGHRQQKHVAQSHLIVQLIS